MLKYQIDRQIYCYEELIKDYPENVNHFSMINSFKKMISRTHVSVFSAMHLILPLPFILSTYYRWKFLLNDLIAGITMLVFHIPQGLAYGLLSGLRPVNGLYASFFPTLIYAFFGTSRHLSIGTFSLMSLLSSIPVLRETSDFNISFSNQTNSDAYEDAKLSISIATTLLTGILQFGLGLFHMGFVMNYMSDSLVSGFTAAAAFHVILSQFNHILGFKITRYSGAGELPYKFFLYCASIAHSNLGTVIVSAICIIVLAVFQDYINPIIKRKLKFPFPIQFLLVVIVTIVSYFANLTRRFDVKIVGPIPKGIPAPMIPDVTIWPRILTDAIMLAFLGFIMNCALGKMFALRYSYDLNYNQEIAAFGLANILGSFFRCTISAAALARTAVVVEVGMMSQIASLISCFLMLIVILFIGPLFEYVPKCVLAAIIIVSLKSTLFQLKELPVLYHLSKFDFYIWLVTFSSTVLLNVPLGVAVGFIFSLLTVMVRLQKPKSQVLGQLPGTDIYKNIKVFKIAKEIRGVKIFRYDAPLYFANAENFQSKIYLKTGVNPQKRAVSTRKVNCFQNDYNHKVNNVSPSMDVEELHMDPNSDNHLKHVIIDCSAMNYIDNVGIRILDEIYTSYRKMQINVLLTSTNCNVRDMLKQFKFAKENLNRIMFVSVHDAVLATQNQEAMCSQITMM